MFEYKILERCRLCKSGNLTTVYDMGRQYVVSFPKDVEEFKKKEEPIPLSLVMCQDCTFVQLGQSVDPDRLYKQFWYKSGINEYMRSILEGIVKEACIRVNAWDYMSVLDIGSNDGTLLSFYRDSVHKVGFDPAENLLEEAKEIAKTEHIYADYFTDKYIDKFAATKFRIITAIAMFYDLEEPAEFLRLIKRVMAEDGILVIQMNYLWAMLNQHAVDNIAHEHLGYYSLKALKNLVESCGLVIVDAQVNDVNGGSIKVTIAKDYTWQTQEDRDRVDTILTTEAYAELDKPETYKKFGERVSNIISCINNYLCHCLKEGKRVYLYGASTRGSTLMQLLDPSVTVYIHGVAERNPEKYGLRMVGTWLPIYSEDECRSQADLFLVLPYHFRDAILAREDRTLLNGTKFLFPLPEPVVYSGVRI